MGCATSSAEHQFRKGSNQIDMAADQESLNPNLPLIRRTKAGFIMRRGPPVSPLPESIISMTELFNLFGVGYRQSHITDPYYMLILDCREPALYQQDHILTARHCSELDELIRSDICKKFTVIVVYGEKVETEAVKKAFKQVNDTGLYVQILEGGFSEFKGFAPFLCTDKQIRTQQDRRSIVVYPSIVLKDALYQGSSVHAKSKEVFRDLKITHVVNVTTELACTFQDTCKYLHLQFADEYGVKLSKVFEKAADFIADALEDPKARVLVHCVMGVSRSSSLTIAFLMKYHGMSFRDAYKHLKDRRPVVAPNTSFVEQLSEYEQQLFGEKLTDPDQVLFL